MHECMYLYSWLGELDWITLYLISHQHGNRTWVCHLTSLLFGLAFKYPRFWPHPDWTPYLCTSTSHISLVQSHFLSHGYPYLGPEKKTNVKVMMCGLYMARKNQSFELISNDFSAKSESLEKNQGTVWVHNFAPFCFIFCNISCHVDHDWLPEGCRSN